MSNAGASVSGIPTGSPAASNRFRKSRDWRKLYEKFKNQVHRGVKAFNKMMKHGENKIGRLTKVMEKCWELLEKFRRSPEMTGADPRYQPLYASYVKKVNELKKAFELAKDYDNLLTVANDARVAFEAFSFETSNLGLKARVGAALDDFRIVLSDLRYTLPDNLLQPLRASEKNIREQLEPYLAPKKPLLIPSSFSVPSNNKRRSRDLVELASGKKAYISQITIDSTPGDADGPLEAVDVSPVTDPVGQVVVLNSIKEFVRGKKCNLSEMYIMTSLDNSDVIIVVNDRYTSQILSLVLGEVIPDRNVLYISTVCADPFSRVTNAGRVALAAALQYASARDLDVELHAVSSVIGYYAKDGFELRRSCADDAPIFPLPPDDIAEALRTNVRTPASERYLAKTVPAGLDPIDACNSTLYGDFDLSDDAAADEAVRKYNKNHCGSMGITMNRCRPPRERASLPSSSKRPRVP